MIANIDKQGTALNPIEFPDKDCQAADCAALLHSDEPLAYIYDSLYVGSRNYWFESPILAGRRAR